MAFWFGDIGLESSDMLFNNTVGQQVIYEFSQELIDMYNRDVAASASIFVGGRTENYKERYKLPGGGMMQRRGRQSPSATTKASGSWDCAYPLLDFSDSMGLDDVTQSYLTMEEYQVHLQNIMNRDTNTYRFELLRSMFNNNSYAFPDELWGSLTVQPLANGDATLYPPTLGAIVDGTSNYFAVSGYAASAISDSNNPITGAVAALQSRWGTPTGGSNIAVFYNPTEQAKLEALASFVQVQFHLTRPGVNTATVDIPGIDERLLRSSWEVRGNFNGATGCKWANIPSGYLLFVHLDAPPPLVERVDMAKANLGTGLQLVGQNNDELIRTSMWRHRFGLGVRNRLNGYVVQLAPTVVSNGTASAGGTSLTVNALPAALASGSTLTFGSVTVTLTAAASASATSITIAPASGSIASGVTATYAAPATYL